MKTINVPASALMELLPPISPKNVFLFALLSPMIPSPTITATSVWMSVMLAPMETQKISIVLKIAGGQDLLILRPDYAYSSVLMTTMLKIQLRLVELPA